MNETDGVLVAKLWLVRTAHVARLSTSAARQAVPVANMGCGAPRMTKNGPQQALDPDRRTGELSPPPHEKLAESTPHATQKSHKYSVCCMIERSPSI